MNHPHLDDKVTAKEYARQVHATQFRKGASQAPYFTHLELVANILIEATNGRDLNLIDAGYLHDSVEDQGVAHSDLVRRFGEDIANLVAEVSDDKSLPKEVRKTLQIETAADKSVRGRMLKLADKIANIESMIEEPPADWDHLRCVTFIQWSGQVSEKCLGLNDYLDARFNLSYKTAADLFSKSQRNVKV